MLVLVTKGQYAGLHAKLAGIDSDTGLIRVLIDGSECYIPYGDWEFVDGVSEDKMQFTFSDRVRIRSEVDLGRDTEMPVPVYTVADCERHDGITHLGDGHYHRPGKYMYQLYGSEAWYTEDSLVPA